MAHGFVLRFPGWWNFAFVLKQTMLHHILLPNLFPTFRHCPEDIWSYRHHYLHLTNSRLSRMQHLEYKLRAPPIQHLIAVFNGNGFQDEVTCYLTVWNRIWKGSL